MRCLVTGGAGFIGSHLVAYLLEKGHIVIALDNLASSKKINLSKVWSHPGFSFIKADIRKKEEIAPSFEKVDWVFHLAALADIVPSIEKPEEYFTTNVDGTFVVMECAKEARVKKVIYAASSSCYGIAKEYPTPETAKLSPEYPYALTKMLGEEILLHWGKLFNIPVLSLRLFNVYGPRARTSGTYGAVFGVFLAQKYHKKPFTVVGTGKQTRDFTYVTDVVKAFYVAAGSKVSQEIFNVGSSGHYSVNRIVELLQGEVIYIPKRPGEPDTTFADVSKIHRMLAWKAEVSLEEGIANLLKHIEEFKDAPVWEPKSIATATEKWFRYLGKESHV